MISDKTGDSLRGLTTRLIVLFLGMVIAGFVIPSPGAGAGGQQSPSLYRAMPAPAEPLTLIVPAVGLRAPIVPIDLDGTVLNPPADPSIVGWWTGSTPPGSQRGQTVITGHTVHTGGGVMDRLGELSRGSAVRIRTERGTMHYRTTGTVVYSKSELAENATDLFRQNRANPRLVLITCTGWNGVDYTSNVIVFAEPLGLRNRPEPAARPRATQG